MGNKLGWVLAGVLLIALVGIFLLVVVFPGHSKSHLDPDDLLLQVQEHKPEHLTGRSMTVDANAGESYYRAIQLSRKHETMIRAAKKRLLSQTTERLTAEERGIFDSIAAAVHEGSQRKQMNFVLKLEPTVLQVRNSPPPIAAAMETVLYAQQLNGYDHERGGSEADFAAAEQIYHDTLTMGYHFANERKLVATARKGYGIQIDMCNRLRTLYTTHLTAKRDQIPKVVAYKAGMDEVRDLYTKKRNLLATIKMLTEEPGSVFDIAENDEDYAWRIEGIMSLGKLKYAVTEKGDKRHVRKLIDRYKDSDDPMVSAAAKAADEMTHEQYMNGNSEWDT